MLSLIKHFLFMLSMMTLNYAYTPEIWPSLLTVLLLVTLAVYAWRRRSVPGASPFTIACLFGAAWASGSVMEYAAMDLASKISWVKFQAAWQLPVATAITCFVLEYTWPGRWLTRRNLALLSVPPILILLVILTDNLYHLAWRGFTFAESIQPQFSPVGWIGFAYIFGVLGTLNLVVFGWLFLRSPQHRWPVVLMLVGQFGGRILYMLERTGLLHSVLPIDLLGMAFEFSMFALALFGFRILDPIPMASRTAIEQLQSGMLVLDPQGRIVSLNPAAERILGAPLSRLRGQPVGDLLPALPCEHLAEFAETEVEFSPPKGNRDGVGSGLETRYYLLEASSLNDWRGLEVGHLLLLHDVTGQKHAQAQLLEQQRALAMLQEREQLARELHDDLGQALAAVHLQATTAKLLLAIGKTDQVSETLENLAETTLQVEADMREYLLGAQTVTSADRPFFEMLREYLVRFSRQYNLPVDLTVQPGLSEPQLPPTVSVQLLRIIQEAQSNVRKHACARFVQVDFAISGDWVRVVVSDDGQGFDPAATAQQGAGFGLQSMRERAEALGGHLEVNSAPGKGTQVVVQVPVSKVNGEK